MPIITENKKLVLTRAKYQPQSIRTEDNSVEFVLSTDNPVVMWKDGLGFVNESLVPSGAEHNDSIPLLNCHDKYSIDKVLGSVREFRAEKDQLIGRLYFADTDESKKAFELVRSGHLTSGSVGYYRIESIWINEDESVKNNGKTYEGPLLLTTKWGLDEFSLVPVPADNNATVRGKNDNGFQVIDENNKKELKEMPNVNELNEQAKTVNEPVEAKKETVVESNGENLERAKKEASVEAVKLERQRIGAINEICAKFGCKDIATRAINEGLSVDETRKLVLDYLSSNSTPLSRAKSNVSIVADEKEKFIGAVTDGLLMRAGITVDKPADGAESFRGHSFINIAQEVLQRNGSNRIYSNTETFNLIMRAGTQSYSDFSHILDNGVKKAVMAGYRLAPSTWKAWAKKGTLPNLEPAQRVGMNDIPEPQKLTEGGELRVTKINDKGEQVQLLTYGNEIRLSRRAILADDFGFFNDISKAIGARCAQKTESLAYSVLTANGTMSDNVTLFHATHGNLLSGGVLSKDTLALAFASMQKQTDKNGSKLNLIPRYLICSADDGLTAEVLTTSINDVSSNVALGNTNFFRNHGLTAISTAFIAQSDGYFLIADPIYGATVEVDFLDGKEGPTIEIKENDDGYLGKKWTYYFDVGAKAIDFRAMNKTPYSA